MSKHHHHPDKGPSGGEAPGTRRKPLQHSPLFGVAGFFILVALIAFIYLSLPSAVPKVLSPSQTAPGRIVESQPL
jgi:hypothetical protein